jgi:hypothetical protein
MRPVPRPQHLISAMIFIAVAILYGYQATYDTRLSESQVYMGASLLKNHDPSLFAADPVFGPSRLWQLHTPALQGIFDLVLIPTDFLDAALPFRILAGIIPLIFMVSMYVLLYRQCRNWSIAAFTSVLSSTIIYVIGSSYWGTGSLASVTPWTFCISVTPLIVVAFLRHIGQWHRLLVVFLLVGLMGNIHLAIAMNLCLVLVIVYLGRQRFAPKAWLPACSFLIVAALGAAPYGAYLLALRQSLNPTGAMASSALAAQAFDAADMFVLYPGVLKSVLNWVLVMAIVVIIPAVIVLASVERYRIRDMGVWVWFVVSVLIVALGLHGLCQFLAAMHNSAPPIIDLVQAGGLIMLPLYVMFSQALTNMFRLVRAHRIIVRLICAALMAVWMIPSDNLRVARYAMLDTATVYMDEQDKPHSVQRHHEAAYRHQELAAIARFAANSTPKDALFIIDVPAFRMLSRRSIVACAEDLNYLFYLTPAKLGDYLALLDKQKSLLHPPAGRANMMDIQQWAIQLHKQEPYAQAGQCYAVIEAGLVGEDNVPATTAIESPQWGRYYKVFRLDVSQTGPASTSIARN